MFALVGAVTRILLNVLMFLYRKKSCVSFRSFVFARGFSFVVCAQRVGLVRWNT